MGNNIPSMENSPIPPMNNIEDDNIDTNIDEPNDDSNDEQNGSNSLQSDAAKLGQSISTTNSQEAKTVLNQVNSVGAKALNSKDAEDVANKIKKAAEGNDEENVDMNDKMGSTPNDMPIESKIKSNYTKLDEIVDSILLDNNKDERKNTIPNKKIGKNPFTNKF